MLLGLFVLMGAGIALVIVANMITHRLRIRDPINKDIYITDCWVIEKRDKETGVDYWVSLFGKKVKTAKPPAAAINVGKKGKKFAECYQLSADEFVWICDQGVTIIEKEVIVIGNDGKPSIRDGKEVKKKEFQIVDVITNKDGKKEYKYVDTFKPYSTVQREVLVGQHKKADEIARGRWTSDKIVTIAALGSIVILCVCLMIFWGDIAKPALDSQRIANHQMQMNSDIADKLSVMLSAIGHDVQGIEISQTATGQVTGNVITNKGETPPMAED